MSIINDDRLRLGCRLSVLQELIDFHDSIFEEIQYDSQSLRLYIRISLCNWRQNGYDENIENEIEIIHLRFEGAFYNGDNRVFKDEDCDGGIYYAKMNDDNEIEFVVEDKDTTVKSYIISADNVYIDSSKPRLTDGYNGIIAESDNYLVVRDYEICFLYFKNEKRRKVFIGDFYGDVDAAIIDRNERFVLMIGYDTILYYLKEPFTNYDSKQSCEQWKMLTISGEGDFCKELIQISDNQFSARYENGFEETITV